MSKLYSEAAKVLLKIDKGRLGIRSALYSEDGNFKNIRKLSALVYGVVNKRSEIESIVKECKIIEHFESHGTAISNHWLLYVLIYEQLFGDQKIQGGGVLANFVRRNKDRIYGCVSDEFPELFKKNRDEQRNTAPRYLRVNQSISSVDDVLKTICEQMKETDQFGEENINEYVCIDNDVKNLLVCKQSLARTLNLNRIPSTNELISSGKVVLQDKGSCFSVISAKILPGDTVLDACSAPGSKSIQAIDMLNKNGCLIALDKDVDRIKILIKRLVEIPYLAGPYVMREEGIFEIVDVCEISDSALSSETGCIFLENSSTGATNTTVNLSEFAAPPKLFIQVLNRDFLTLERKNDVGVLPWYNFKSNLSKVRVILLDPSCSGSGLAQHGKMNKSEIQERLRSLSEFQTKMLVHSLTSFPSAETVCYSTCSIFREENELVVLNAVNKCRKLLNFNYFLDKAIENWRNPCLNEDSNKEILDKCVFVNPKYHNCRGFFLAKFSRNN